MATGFSVVMYYFMTVLSISGNSHKYSVIYGHHSLKRKNPFLLLSHFTLILITQLSASTIELNHKYSNIHNLFRRVAIHILVYYKSSKSTDTFTFLGKQTITFIRGTEKIESSFILKTKF